VKTFVSPHWTLEYCIARSRLLSPLLYQAVKGAIDEIRKDDTSIAAITDTYKAFSNGRKQEEIAFDLYQNLIVREKISKPIVAQHMAKALEQKESVTAMDLSDEDSTKYLIDAIEYVTSNNNNQ